MIRRLLPGEPAPWFRAPALEGNPQYRFDSVAGRAVVMLFAGSAGSPKGQAALEVLARHRALFDDEAACFFGVTIDPADAAAGRIAAGRGVRWFLDYDMAVSRAYGAVGAAEGGAVPLRPHWLLLDAMLRVVDTAEIDQGERLMTSLQRLIDAGPDMPAAPLLVVPRVFEPAMCRRLIGLYEAAGGGRPSGFMRERDGITVLQSDPSFKRRSDHLIEDVGLIDQLRARLQHLLVPMIARAFQFEATRVERWIVACYDEADGGGHFRAHRDNTTKGTAHRRFACTINLNAEEYDGGDLRFPEFGRRTYRAPTGGALLFSCSLLHEVTPVTRGRRYAFLPFFYDDAGAQLRERNLAFLEGGEGSYSAGVEAD